jgi:hypothetical protein
VSILKLNWFKILGLVLVQYLVGYLVFTFYLFFTWIFFGEGADSSLYTSQNEIIWAISPAIGATILNGYRISQGWETADIRKIQTYIAIQILFFVGYSVFTVERILTNGYHI